MAQWPCGGSGGRKEKNNRRKTTFITHYDDQESAYKGQKPFSWVGNIAHNGSVLAAFWELEKGLFKVQDHNLP